jgi:hypothetical protein
MELLKMGKILINLNDGTVCELVNTVVVDTDKLNEAGKALLQEWEQGGNDNDARRLGEAFGRQLERFVDNDLTHANSMSFSPKALRDEFENSHLTDIPEFKLGEQLTDDQLEELGQYILSSDYLWNVYQEELLSGIRNYARDIMGRKI